MRTLIGKFNPQGKISDYVNQNSDTLVMNDSILHSKNIDSSTHGTTHVFFAGRIYNTVSLKKKYSPTSETGAGYAHAIFEQAGVKGLTQIEGGFTVVICTPDSQYIVRDRHGRSLQIYYTDRFFMSDPMSLHAIKNFEVKPDIQNLAKFLHLGYIPAPQTAYAGVKKLAAGNYLQFSNGKLTEHELYPYSARQNTPKTKLNEQELIAQYEHLHKDAIARRIEGQTNVGVLLSGGFDSGGNICALRDIYQGPIQAFSIGFKNDKWSELPLAQVMTDAYGATLEKYEIDGSEINALPELIREFGDPFHEGGMLVNHAVMKMVSKSNLDVALGGDGNDQLFGTGGKELAMYYKLRNSGASMLQYAFDALTSIPASQKDNLLFRLRFHNTRLMNMLQVDNFGFDESSIKKLFGKTVDSSTIFHKIKRNGSSFEELYGQKNYFIDLKQTINEVILNKASRAASLFDNHLAFPYLDNSIHNFLDAVPYNLKTKGTVSEFAKGKAISKYLLKAYISPKLPSEIVNRKKQGGFAPLPLFLQDQAQYATISRIILDSEICQSVLNRGEVAQLLQNYKNLAATGGYWFWYKQTQASKICNLLVLAIWWDLFITKSERKSLTDF